MSTVPLVGGGPLSNARGEGRLYEAMAGVSFPACATCGKPLDPSREHHVTTTAEAECDASHAICGGPDAGPCFGMEPGVPCPFHERMGVESA